MSVSQDHAQAITAVTSGQSHTWEAVADEVLAVAQARLEPMLRKAADALYGEMLYSVQDYFADNVKYNVAGRIAASDRQAHHDRERADAADMLNAQLYSALKGLDESILGIAESNASGNPQWEYVSSRIYAARAAIAKAESRS